MPGASNVFPVSFAMIPVGIIAKDTVNTLPHSMARDTVLDEVNDVLSATYNQSNTMEQGVGEYEYVDDEERSDNYSELDDEERSWHEVITFYN